MTLSEVDRYRGEVVLRLLDDWSHWVDRRVETVSFPDPVSFRRRMSVDFTAAAVLPQDLSEPSVDIYVPLAVLRKASLVNFGLWDEVGHTLPLPTRRQNSAIAAAALATLAEVRHGDSIDGPATVPPTLLKDFYDLAASKEAAAFTIWDRLPELVEPPVGPASGEPLNLSEEELKENAWREAIAGDPAVMSLARDLAEGFLVLVLVGRDLGRRRVIKYAYDEPVEQPRGDRGRSVRRGLALASYARTALSGGTAPQGVKAHGVGRLRMSAKFRETEDGSTEDDTTPSILSRVSFLVTAPVGPAIAFDADASGRSVVQLESVTYTVTLVVPVGVVVQPPATRRVEVPVGGEVSVPFEVLRLAREQDVDRPLGLRTRLARGFGWSAKPLRFDVPSIGQCASYHFEVEAPDGLQITSARLTAGTSYPSARSGRDDAGLSDVARETRQRAHLYLEDVPDEESGFALIRLRARASIIIGPALLSALFATLLIFGAAFRPLDTSYALGPAISLLLLVPGGIAAYAARPREHSVTSSALAGLRGLGVASAVTAFSAAGLMVFTQAWSLDRNGNPSPSGVPGLTELGLWVCFGLAACVLMILTRTLALNRRPPEQRDRPDKQPTASRGGV